LVFICGIEIYQVIKLELGVQKDAMYKSSGFLVGLVYAVRVLLVHQKFGGFVAVH
jgi:hypothetical protein